MNEQIKAGADIHAGDGGYSEGTQEQYDAFVKVRNKSLAQGRIKELAEQAGLKWKAQPPHYTNTNNPIDFPVSANRDLEKFAELIVRECAKLNKIQSYELSGVIVDTEDGDGFDNVCLNTVKRVERYLQGDELLEHFGVKL